MRAKGVFEAELPADLHAPLLASEGLAARHAPEDGG
jgi:hypothetical protein